MKKMTDYTTRRASFQKLGIGLLGIFGIGVARAANRESSPGKQVAGDIVSHQDIPMFSGAVRHGNTLYVSGKGAQFKGDIKTHTDHVLKELETELTKNGSSMEKVLKVNVYLADIADFEAMNEVYRGRFGTKPPVRTTVAVYGGVPGISLVEMDCIAALD
jgi:enamine deaminase RidA (YjgF/YER057c/UK114 family)